MPNKIWDWRCRNIYILEHCNCLLGHIANFRDMLLHFYLLESNMSMVLTQTTCSEGSDETCNQRAIALAVSVGQCKHRVWLVKLDGFINPYTLDVSVTDQKWTILNVTLDLVGLNSNMDIRHNRCLSEEEIAKIDLHLKKIYVSVLVGLWRKDYELSLKELRGKEYTRYREEPEKSKDSSHTGTKRIHNMFCACACVRTCAIFTEEDRQCIFQKFWDTLMQVPWV
jgi:hypothetical protein